MKNILLIATGSVAIEKLEKIVNLLKVEFNIKIIATEYAKENFDQWKNIKIEEYRKNLKTFPFHIELAKWADQMVVVPATANTIAKFCSGIADSVVLTTLIAARQPVLFVPAMNTYMFNALEERAIIKKLYKMGHMFIGPCIGELREGESGMGRMTKPTEIVAKLKNLLLTKKSKKILISIGSSKSYIDPIRYITSGATGMMGTLIANELRLLGHKVKILDVSSLTNKEALGEILSMDIDTYISTAAFSDFKVKKYSESKIKKGSISKINLLPNIDVLSEVSKKNIDIYGFKLDNNKNNAIIKKNKLNLKGIIWNKIDSINFSNITGAIILESKHIGFNNKPKSYVAKMIAQEI